MANEFARNIQDAGGGFLYTFALPTQVGEANGKTSSAIDLSGLTFNAENLEVELLVPTLSSTICPNSSTAGVYYEIHTSNSSTFNGEVGFYRENYTGTGVNQTATRSRIANYGGRYVRGKVWLGTTCTDASAVTATLTLRF